MYGSRTSDVTGRTNPALCGILETRAMLRLPLRGVINDRANHRFGLPAREKKGYDEPLTPSSGGIPSARGPCLLFPAPRFGDSAIPLLDELGRARHQVGANRIAFDSEPNQLHHVGKVLRAG